jgi:hypothetical protein
MRTVPIDNTVGTNARCQERSIPKRVPQRLNSDRQELPVLRRPCAPASGALCDLSYAGRCHPVTKMRAAGGRIQASRAEASAQLTESRCRDAAPTTDLRGPRIGRESDAGQEAPFGNLGRFERTHATALERRLAIDQPATSPRIFADGNP